MKLSQMETEAREVPHILAKQFTENAALLTKLTAHLRSRSPRLAMTIARGSSDHAATFAKYLLETRAGLITASAAPAVFTLYKKQLSVENCLVLGISQSGASPDVAEMLAAARQHGAMTVAFVNHTDSVLARSAEYVIPLWAGLEKAVAATKTYLATLGALIQFIAIYTQDSVLLNAVSQLPTVLQNATMMDWFLAIEEYKSCHNTFVIGRGYGYPIAQEAALKFKETARIHAEAFSGAELLHGPFSLIEKNFPLLIFGQRDETLQSIIDISTRMKTLGAKVLLALPQNGEGEVEKNLQEAASLLLPSLPTLHPVCDPLLMIQSFYIMMARLSLARGLNPDQPHHLTKITQTW